MPHICLRQLHLVHFAIESLEFSHGISLDADSEYGQCISLHSDIESGQLISLNADTPNMNHEMKWSNSRFSEKTIREI